MGKNSLVNARDVKDMGFNTWVGKIPWRRAWQSTPVFLPWTGTWWATVHRVSKESDVTEVTKRVHTHTHTHTYIRNLNLYHLYLPTIYQVPLDSM